MTIRRSIVACFPWVKTIHQGITLLDFFYQDVRRNYLGQLFPVYPHTLNLLANDICNSRCQMCNIWRRKQDNEYSPVELDRILSDPLFKRLKYVGVSGGEPTLRADLPEIFNVLCQKKPRLKGTGIITNAIQKDKVISSIEASARFCKRAGIPFNVMVSLDGIGEIHDRIRGRKGNYESAVSVIRYFRDETDIPVLIGCTITKDNVFFVDEVLDFCKAEEVYGRFRIAEFIRRLYNEEQTEYIRNFSVAEAYHLGLFFSKLEYTYEGDQIIKRTYRNIRQMVMEQANRLIRCPYQTSAVTLDSRANLVYCAPKSPLLGNTLKASAHRLYIENLSIRKEILAQSCDNCIHDYHTPPTISEIISRSEERLWKWRLSLKKALSSVSTIPTVNLNTGDKDPQRVLIIGWYGTETAGDKAILGEIIHRIYIDYPDVQIILGSLYPFLSKVTVKELKYPEVLVIPVYSKIFWKEASIADRVIVGGGPLMHIEELGMLLNTIILAKKRGNYVKIAGCGIGPLDKGEHFQDAVCHILRLADEIVLRDTESVTIARQWTGRSDIICGGDPAIGFVNRWKESNPGLEQKYFLNLYLREWTSEYQGQLTDEQFLEVKSRFEAELGRRIREICDYYQLRPQLFPMHHFCIGMDDRDFNRRFAKEYLRDLKPVVENVPISLNEILKSMKEASLSICMRFHSILFAHTLNIPFCAIDYTNGGKIAGYMRDHGIIERMRSLQDISNGEWFSLDWLD